MRLHDDHDPTTTPDAPSDEPLALHAALARAALARAESARRAPAPRPTERPADRSVVQEGLRAGTVAAAGVALLFAAMDLTRGEPLATPVLLGSAVGRALGVAVMAGSASGAVLGYSVLHLAAFVAIATAVAAVVRRARGDASVLAAALLLVAVAEFAFCGLVAVLAETTLTVDETWPRLALGNVLGVALLGGWTWRAHPELRGEFADAVRGTDDGAGAAPTR